MESFAERLAAALTLREMSEADLGKRLGITQQAINNWKTGKNKSKRMYEAAKVLRISPDWLIEGHGPMELSSDKKPKLVIDLESIISRLEADKQETLLKIAKSFEKEQKNVDKE